MDRESLMRMLNIAPAAPAKAAAKEEPGYAVPIADNRFFFELDKWDQAQGDRLVREVRECEYTDPAALADFHAAYFQLNPVRTSGTKDPVLNEFLDVLVSSPQYVEQRIQTTGNGYLSQLAVEKLMPAWHRHRMMSDYQGESPEQEPKSREERMYDLLPAINQAVGQIQDGIDEFTQFAAAMGCGDEEANSSYMQMDAVCGLFEKMKNNASLRRIIQLAGRYRRVARAKQKEINHEVFDDMVGIELAGDVGRLLAVEMSRLGSGCEGLRLDAMRRLAESQSQCREMTGKQEQGEGPVVLCLDESGSMRGNKIEHGKAFALALAWLAKHQNRWCLLAAFSSGADARVCILDPRRSNESELLEWITAFRGGGTSLSVPMKTIPTKYWKVMPAAAGKADMILITDGIVEIDPVQAQFFNKWKSENRVRMNSLLVECKEDDARMMRSISDEVAAIDSLSENNNKVANCFRI